MTTPCTLRQTHVSPGFVHVTLPGDQRWGCTVAGRGRGVVVATVHLGSATIGFDVDLSDGTHTRAWRAEVRGSLALVHP